MPRQMGEHKDKEGYKMRYCRKCGQSVEELMILAMLRGLGVHTTLSPAKCSYGGEHEFVDSPSEMENHQATQPSEGEVWNKEEL